MPKKEAILYLQLKCLERDNQIIIDEYFSDLIKESSFETEARLWKNYGTDYKPLLTFAKRTICSL
ncbi:MAG: ChaN family lipoprotein [Bacteroidetes bacterium]|nr:ChaN family lipoprotein [Bacteroidota bacterium]